MEFLRVFLGRRRLVCILSSASSSRHAVSCRGLPFVGRDAAAAAAAAADAPWFQTRGGKASSCVVVCTEGNGDGKGDA